MHMQKVVRFRCGMRNLQWPWNDGMRLMWWWWHSCSHRSKAHHTKVTYCFCLMGSSLLQILGNTACIGYLECFCQGPSAHRLLYSTLTLDLSRSAVLQG